MGSRGKRECVDANSAASLFRTGIKIFWWPPPPRSSLDYMKLKRIVLLLLYIFLLSVRGMLVISQWFSSKSVLQKDAHTDLITVLYTLPGLICCLAWKFTLDRSAPSDCPLVQLSVCHSTHDHCMWWHNIQIIQYSAHTSHCFHR